MKEKRDYSLKNLQFNLWSYAPIGIFLLVGMLCLLYSTYFSHKTIKQHIISQQMAVLGNIYEKDKEICAQVLVDMFKYRASNEVVCIHEQVVECDCLLYNEDLETKITAGKEALFEFGYTKEGLEYLYQQQGLENLYYLVFIWQVTIMIFMLLLLWQSHKKRCEQEEVLINDINQRKSMKKTINAEIYRNCNPMLINEIQMLLNDLFAYQKECVEVKQMAQNFVENVAHQIKTPLSCVSISLDLLLERKINNFTLKMCEAVSNEFGGCLCQLKKEKLQVNSSEAVCVYEQVANTDCECLLHGLQEKEIIEEAFRYLKNIEILMKRLLDIGRLESGKLLLKKEPVFWEELLNDCKYILDPQEQRIIFETESVIQKNVVFYGDYEWLKEAFLNILKNCLEHDKRKKPIFVNLRFEKELIFIKIRDYGTGIAKQDLAHIFDRFYIPEHAKSNHTGIGLNLAKLIIEKHFGMIEAVNHEKGGAEFSIVFPIYELKNEKFSM